MTIKKTTATTTDAVKPAVKATPAKKTTTTKAKPEVKAEVKAKAAPTAAATHKAPARKSAPKAEVKALAALQPTFDESAFRAEIEREAYLLWEARGHEHGQAHEDWNRAVEIVRARNAK